VFDYYLSLNSDSRLRIGRKVENSDHVQTSSELLDAFFFKFSLLTWKILGAISQSTYFAVSYSGKLDRILDRMQLNGACATYSRKVAVIYTSVAWAMVILNGAFTVYSVFFARGNTMNIALAPVTVHVHLSDLLVPRIVMLFFSVYNTGAWIFPHAMTFVLATIFTRQYRLLSRSFDKMLAESDERRLSDSDRNCVILISDLLMKI